MGTIRGPSSTGRAAVHNLAAADDPCPCPAHGVPVPTTELGARGERIAVAFLHDAGLRVLDRNWRCRDGELDVVARDGDALVFCEVKTRTGVGFGHPAEAVTSAKRRRLRLLARSWLAAHDHHAPDLRFDVVGVHVPAAGPVRVTHLRNAF